MNKSKGFMHNILKPFWPNSSEEGNSEENLQIIADQEQKVFAFDVLIAATRNFHQRNKLGEGGFGPVYKGKLVDEREVAVKKLSKNSNQGKKEFLNEAKLLASIQHKNVVNLLGYCVHGEEKLLVYEYVANESLDKLLFKQGSRNTLDWNRRHDIIMGVAKGLLYLHDGSHTCIIHRDIKASNILLDDKWVPKIADFGMARLFSDEHSHVKTRVAGTNGYMAPEYVMHGRLSIKVDVFSFGVVILELICGQKNSSFGHDECQSLLDWVYKLYKKGQTLEVIDPRLAPSSIPDEIATCIQIGLLCVQSDPQLRPTMQRVVVMLCRKQKTMEEPIRPGYPGSRYKRRSHKSVASLSSTETSSGASATHSFGSTVVTTNTATASISGLASPISDPDGKRPVKATISGLTSTRSDPHGQSPVKATTSGLKSTRSDPHRKHHAKATISGLTSTRSDPHGKRPMVYDTDSEPR